MILNWLLNLVDLVEAEANFINSYFTSIGEDGWIRSTPEMTVFLREYGEKHEKVEKETLNLMKTLKQEKK